MHSNKINLPAVQVRIVQEFRENRLGCIHIEADDLTDKLTQKLGTVLGFVFLLCTDLAPEDLLQNFYIPSIIKPILQSVLRFP